MVAMFSTLKDKDFAGSTLIQFWLFFLKPSSVSLCCELHSGAAGTVGLTTTVTSPL